LVQQHCFMLLLYAVIVPLSRGDFSFFCPAGDGGAKTCGGRGLTAAAGSPLSPAARDSSPKGGAKSCGGTPPPAAAGTSPFRGGGVLDEGSVSQPLVSPERGDVPAGTERWFRGSNTPSPPPSPVDASFRRARVLPLPKPCARGAARAEPLPYGVAGDAIFAKTMKRVPPSFPLGSPLGGAVSR
jgi:hypothetical protein